MVEYSAMPTRFEDELDKAYIHRLKAHIRLLEMELDGYRELIERLGRLESQIRSVKSFHINNVERRLKD